MDKILITGGSGLLGSNMARLAVSSFDVYATYNTHKVALKDVHFFHADLTQKEDINKIKQIKPDVIVHCAALTNIDFCEEHPSAAHVNNVLASSSLAEAAKEIKAYMIYISTDCVFDGEKGDYREDDLTNPINVYGKTKLEAERKVMSIHPSSCVVRTNIFGWNKLNKFSLAEWMIDKLAQGKELPGFKDVTFSPILVNDLTEILFKLYEKKYVGILHVGGSDACSKLEFAYMIADIFGYDRKHIKPVNYSDGGLKAPRGKNLFFNGSRVQTVLSQKLPDIRSGLQRMKQLQDSHYVDGLKNG